MAQTWRAAMITADSKQIDTWEGAADNMPERLAAGAYLVVGRARARLRQWEPAALALLRVAILYPQHRELAARALLEAGRALEGLDRKAEAARLYRELIRNYPQQTLSVAEAQKRMEGMRKKE